MFVTVISFCIWLFLVYNLKYLFETRQKIQKFIKTDTHFIVYPPPVTPLVLAA